MKLVLSWTDQCFLGLLFLSFIFTLRALRKKHVRIAFAELFNKAIAVSAGLILMFFLGIAVLDSIHYKTAGMHSDDAPSLLDRILAPLGENQEKTYSSPLALTLFNKVTVLEHGKPVQTYLRLHHISDQLKTPEDVRHLLWRIIALSMLVALSIIGSCWLIFRLFIQKTKQFSAVQISILLTLFTLITFSLMLYWLSRDIHVFGTGKIGQDILYYTLKSIRTGLVIGTVTTLFMLPIAMFAGVAAGYFGGIIDDIIQYIYTTLSSIPGILLITASVLSMQTYITNHPEKFPTLNASADARLLVLCIILGVTGWTSLCRLLRAETLKLREIDFVLAGRALGSSSLFIIRKHLFPNIMHIVLITLVLDFSFLVLAEAVLSYVGVGVSPMTISWGNMINSARLELAREPLVWWPMFSALVFMFALVLASNLFADAIRDAFDPGS